MEKKYHCEYCENKSICKWSDDFNNGRKEVERLMNLNDDCPIEINISCIKFRNKNIGIR